jgi:hypothetical protein
MTRTTGTLQEDVCTCMIWCRSILLRIRNFSDKVLEKIKSHVLCSITFFFFFSKMVTFIRECGRRWDSQPDRPQMMTCSMHLTCMIPKATDTLRICNAYCFFTTGMVTRTRLNKMFVHTLLPLFIFISALLIFFYPCPSIFFRSQGSLVDIVTTCSLVIRETI